MITVSGQFLEYLLGNVMGVSCTIFVQPTDDVVTVLPQPRQLRRAARRHVQDVPHVLIRALETAEPDNTIAV